MAWLDPQLLGKWRTRIARTGRSRHDLALVGSSLTHPNTVCRRTKKYGFLRRLTRITMD